MTQTSFCIFAFVCVLLINGQNVAFTKGYSVNIVAPIDPRAPIQLVKVPEVTQVQGNIKTIKNKKGKVQKESKNQAMANFVAIYPELSVEGDITTSDTKSTAALPGSVRTNIVLKKNGFKNQNAPPTEPDAPEPDIPIELGVKEPENDNELGSAFENDPENMNKVDGKKKGCEKQPCTSSNEESGGDDDEASEPVEQDIPVELGSAIKENSDVDVDNADISDEKEQVTYLPFWTPSHFVIVDRSESNDDENVNNSGSGDDVIEQMSGSGSTVGLDEGEFYGMDRKRSVSENSDSVQQWNTSTISVNTDGDYDGELLTTSKENTVEINSRSSSTRTRRSVAISDKIKSKRMKKRRRGGKKEKMNIKKMKKSSSRNSKRSDIDADKELLQTIENLNSMAASKREVPSHKNKKPMKGYMKHLAQDVRGVLKEAKTALRDTARVIRGLHRVISGAGVLSSFTNNAVKFANYFSMEPSNATVDYLEEKAIVSVLEAQKAAAAAKQAAKLAKLAFSKTKEVESRMEIAEKSHRKGNMLNYLKIANRQANRAEKAAKLATTYKAKTEKDVMIMDQELRKMGSQMQVENDMKSAALENLTIYKSSFDQMKSALKNHTRNKPQKEAKLHSVDALNVDQQVSPDIQLLLPKIYKETKGRMSASQDDDRKDVESVEDPTQSSGYANYFYMKQKQLEKELSNATKSSSQVPNKRVEKKFVGKSVKIIDMIPPSEPEDVKQPDDRIELDYIASLNKKIASIKKEEEEATQRLKAVELARTFAAGKTHFSEDLNPSKVLEENANIRAFEKSEARSEVASSAKTKSSAILDKEYSTHETTLSNMRNSAKKQTIRKETFKKPIPHLYPGEYTGFKKQDISNYEHFKSSHPRNEVDKSNSISLKSKVIFPEREAYNDIESALSEDENTVIAEDFDHARKRQQILSENNLVDDVTSDDIDGSQSGWDVESGESGSGNLPATSHQVALIKKIDHGPVSVTVMVNKNTVKREKILKNRKENLIDPFGFNQIRETNEGGISDRTIIPEPYSNIKRSDIPSPPSRQYTQSDVVNDNKK